MTMESSNNPSIPEDLGRTLGSFIEEQRKVNEELRGYFRKSDRQYHNISQDLSVLKGGHALSAVLGNAAQIANKLGYQFISRMPEQELSAFANLATASGATPGDALSFSNADVVLLVQDSASQPHYIAIEVSYTVRRDDIRRAKRNAEYLQQFTTMPSLAAVVGVDIPETNRHYADANSVLWHIERPT